MKCKLVNIPLESSATSEKEGQLNEFLAAAPVKRIFASVANSPQGPLWSVLCFFEEGASVTGKASARAQVSLGAAGSLIDVPEPQDAGASRGVSPEPANPLTREQIKSIMALKKWRAEQAAHEGVPLYMVAQNRWLEDVVRMPAKTVNDLQKVPGLGEWRVRKYGDKMLQVLNTAIAGAGAWPAASPPTGAGTDSSLKASSALGAGACSCPSTPSASARA